MHQLDLIVDVLGSPKEADIRGCDKAKNYMKQMPFKYKKPLNQLFPNKSPAALDLLDKMLKFDPLQRITAEEALNHPYLASLHDPEDEPTCEPFDFSFDEMAKTGDLHAMLYQEIMNWNYEYNNLAGDAKMGAAKVTVKK